DRFFASLYGKPVPGLAFFMLSLVSTQQRRSFPIRVAQVVRSDAEKAASKAKAARRKQTPSPAQRRPGRPKGSKNKAKTDVTLTPDVICRSRFQCISQEPFNEHGHSTSAQQRSAHRRVWSVHRTR